MSTSLRQQLLASTLLVSALTFAAPAMAQDQTEDPAAQPPTGPVESQPTPSVSSEGEQVGTTQDIIVTGSRIPQPNLESAAPITVVSDQDVKLSGSTRIEDVLNQLPSVGAAQASGVSNGATGTAEVDLRYLGSKRTLVLVNGRRLMPGDPNDPFQNLAPDLNTIPAALIKRVEVLTGGASSVYGADAVAGVVNFILDTNFEGIRFDGNYSIWQHNQDDPSVGSCVSVQASSGCTAVGQDLNMSDIINARRNTPGIPAEQFPLPTGSVWDGRQLDGTISIGAGFDDGRGHALGYFGYRNVKPVLQGDRDYSACVIQNNTSSNPRCGGSATAAPGTALLFNPTNPGTTTIAALGPGTITVGAQNFFNFGPLNYFQRPDERYVAGAFANYEISEQLEPYLEFMFMDDRTLAQIAPSGDFGNTLTINCDNPFMSAAQRTVICDPFNQINGFFPGGFPLAVGAPYNPNPGAAPINFIDPTTGGTFNRAFFQLLRRNVEGGPRISDLKHQAFRGVLGLRGDLTNVFSYDTYFQYGRVNYDQVYKNEFSLARLLRALDVVDADPGPGVTPVCRTNRTGQDPTCVPYDPFGAAPSQEAIDFLNVFGVINGSTSEQIANANITGNLGEMGWQTPWATDGVGVNAGVEYRREAVELRPDQSFQDNDLTGQGAPTLPIDGNFRVWEVFAEALVPIAQQSFVEELSLGLGYRKSWYTTSGDRKYDTDTYKLSLEFAPIRDVRIRGAYNRAVRAPNIQELFAPQFVGLDGTRDPCAGHTIQPTEFGCIATGLAAGRATPSNPAGQYNGLLGGVADLNPEKGTTKTLGVVLQPSFLRRFALTVDYWDIHLEDAIQGLGADSILAACVNNSTATFVDPACSLVHRDPSGSIWLTSQGFVEDLPKNTSTIDTNGIDINASYAHGLFNFGNLSWSFVGTWLNKYRNDNGISEPYDCVGLYGPVCSGGTIAAAAPIPEWRHKLRATWQSPFGLGISAQWRYVGKVDAETLEDNETLQADVNSAGVPNTFDPGLHIGANHYLDLAGTYTLFDRLNLRFGVNNVFDNDPPRVTSGHGDRPGSNLCPTGPCNGNTYPGTWDALGRLFWAGATLDFTPKRSAPIVPAVAPLPPPPPPAPPATQTCPDGTVILATEVCPAPPPPPPPPVATPERG